MAAQSRRWCGYQLYRYDAWYLITCIPYLPIETWGFGGAIEPRPQRNEV